MQTQRIRYDDDITRKFVAASVIWGFVGMLVGAIVALQLAFWQANLGPYLSFGRLRPLHTNAVIFAFVGNMLFAGVYYSSQRLLKARLASDVLSRIHFWGWQAIIVAAAITLPLGLTQGKEYAELEWPIDIAIAIVWLTFATNFFWTIAKRNEKQLYVALWFYISTIVAVTVLHVINSLVIPVGPFKSYSIFGGVQDALIQWWYGHNAVAFVLTTPILGIMYYFVPKASGRPVFSYRLSIIHFWSLVFLYIWAGPHHLLNTALPDWAQTLGMVFSIMLLAPSWGGMLNGLLTLRGAWSELRNDPVLKFFAAAVTFYGMATFEGPLLSIKSVSGIAHYTDWIIAHVHVGALGWNGFMAAGMFYWLVPRLYGTQLHSRDAANAHFYIATFGILLYAAAMWTSGVTQGLMWRAENQDGGLMYPSFVETVIALRPMYWMRLFGGTLYLVGFGMMAWNLIATARSGEPVDGQADVVIATPERGPSAIRLVFGTPVLWSIAVLALLGSATVISPAASAVAIVFAAICGLCAAVLYFEKTDDVNPTPVKTTWHSLIEGRALAFTVLTVAAVLIGGVAEIVPMVITGNDKLAAVKGNTPYAALELEGRDVFLKEGCYNCHSQMIRPFAWETARFGAASREEDTIFDHPFQWGSKRTGPDLARIGGRYSDVWHYKHMLDPRELSPGSNMPPYRHLLDQPIDFRKTADKLRAMRNVGVPYTPEQIGAAGREAARAGRLIATGLARELGVPVAADSELIALIGYLQRLGRGTSPIPKDPGSGSPEVASKGAL